MNPASAAPVCVASFAGCCGCSPNCWISSSNEEAGGLEARHVGRPEAAMLIRRGEDVGSPAVTMLGCLRQRLLVGAGASCDAWILKYKSSRLGAFALELNGGADFLGGKGAGISEGAPKIGSSKSGWSH